MHTVLTACDSAPDSPTVEAATPPVLGPLECFARVVDDLFHEVDWHGLTTVYDGMPAVEGVRLDIRPEPWQDDPTVVYVNFRSGIMGIWHRFTASDLGGAR